MIAAMNQAEALRSARWWFATLQVEPGNVVLVRRRLQEAGAKPEDIGTTDAVLDAYETDGVTYERLVSEVEDIERLIADNSDKVIALAKRIVREGLEEVPTNTLTEIPALHERLGGIQTDLEEMHVDPQNVLGDLSADLGDDKEGDAILELAVRVVKLTNHVFAWAQEEAVPPGESFESEEVEAVWEEIVDELEEAGSGLADLGLNDQCLSRLQKIADLRPVPDPPAEVPTPTAKVIDLQTRRARS